MDELHHQTLEVSSLDDVDRICSIRAGFTPKHWTGLEEMRAAFPGDFDRTPSLSLRNQNCQGLLKAGQQSQLAA